MFKGVIRLLLLKFHGYISYLFKNIQQSAKSKTQVLCIVLKCLQEQVQFAQTLMSLAHIVNAVCLCYHFQYAI